MAHYPYHLQPKWINLAPNSGSLRVDNITVLLKFVIDWHLLPW